MPWPNTVRLFSPDPARPSRFIARIAFVALIRHERQDDSFWNHATLFISLQPKPIQFQTLQPSPRSSSVVFLFLFLLIFHFLSFVCFLNSKSSIFGCLVIRFCIVFLRLLVDVSGAKTLPRPDDSHIESSVLPLLCCLLPASPRLHMAQPCVRHY